MLSSDKQSHFWFLMGFLDLLTPFRREQRLVKTKHKQNMECAPKPLYQILHSIYYYFH